MTNFTAKFSKYQVEPANLPNNILYWKISSDEHFRASEILWQQTRRDISSLKVKSGVGRYFAWLDDVYLLLAGYTIETLMKGGNNLQ